MTIQHASRHVLDPLYRRTFVGRTVERSQLEAAFDASMAGSGRLAVVVGGPGIGKKALCEQLTAYATQHGGQLLIGHCYEAGTRSLPYLPFIEGLRGYVVERDMP